MNINFLHICEYSFFSEDKKLNILGLFDGMSADGFPFSHPKFSIVLNLKGEIPETGLRLQILSPEKTAIVSVPIIKKPEFVGKSNTNLIFNLLGILFPVEGDYSVVVDLNGTRISPERSDKISAKKI